ncbi:tetraacyldisaccharide 4'-kinase [Neorhodopirellula pilleata]|uniref:Tetraacyldisaccharide 4'-kinase n=1 Tax=Neorhodopirellula pilleata TaxID=2714738 RepID=A0A5C5ZZR3_9BACT|nr:tetraacyldisaccharide 4'-kinase [Neorhodopirellula pilleata]TWT92646.1 Tetraacyldisaccharide 4'-kinase [Neorhodopirellula pilleata]
MNFDHRSLLSGESKGPRAWATRSGLHVASWLYGAAARYRRFQYDQGRKPILRADVPVISVGNLTTGGTGKTPIVCEICSSLREMGLRVSIVSRGYGAGESGVNDEAMEIAARLPDVPHVQHPDRVEAARIAVDELEAEVIVMDDGFQHRRLHRDLDIVVIDATCPFGFGHLLPRGYLREPASSLSRAGLVVLTRTDQVAAQQIQSIRSQVHRHAPEIEMIETVHRPVSIGFEHTAKRSIETLKNRPIGLISAIGNPDAFERTVRACGGIVRDHFRLPDHDGYDRDTRKDLRAWVDALKSKGELRTILCTHKDHVKLATDQIAGVELGFLMIDLQIVSDGGAELLGRRLTETTSRQF